MDSSILSSAPSAATNAELDTKTSETIRSKYTPVGWRAWYTGGRVFESAKSEDWADLPSEGLLVAHVYLQDLKLRLRVNARFGETVYWLKRFSDGDWTICCDSRADAVLDGIPDHDIKEGRWTSEREMDWAIDDSRRLKDVPPHGD